MVKATVFTYFNFPGTAISETPMLIGLLEFDQLLRALAIDLPNHSFTVVHQLD